MRVVRVNLLLGVAGAALAMAAPAHASAPISAHAMVHTLLHPEAEKERIFSEARDLGAAYIRVDVELSGDLQRARGRAELGRPRRGDRSVEAASPARAGHPARLAGLGGRGGVRPPERARGGARGGRDRPLGDLERAGRRLGVRRDPGGLRPDAERGPRRRSRRRSLARRWCSAACRAHTSPAWLQRVFDTPGADALHKFDIANVHLRGTVDAVVNRYDAFRSWLAEHGFHGPLWVTELGYPADPAFQTDPAYKDGDASQAAYLTQSLLGLGEAGAPEVFVTLRDNSALEGKYVSEGLEQIDETPGGDYPVTRRASFAAVHRLIENWDQLMAWRQQQRDYEQDAARRAGEGRDLGRRREDRARAVPRRPPARARGAGRPRPAAAYQRGPLGGCPAGSTAPARSSPGAAPCSCCGARSRTGTRGARTRTRWRWRS